MRLIDRILPKAKDYLAFAPPAGDLPKKALPFLWIFAKALRWSVATDAILGTICSGLAMLEPFFIGRIVQNLSTLHQTGNMQPALVWIAGYILFAQLLSRALSQTCNFILGHFRPMCTLVVRRRLVEYLFTHSYRYFQDDYAGRLAGKVIEMPQATTDIIDLMIDTVSFLVANFVVSITVLGMIGWPYAIAVFLISAATLALCARQVPRICRLSDIAAASTQKMRGRYLDTLTNIGLVKLFARERFEDDIVSEAVVDAGATAQTRNMQQSLLWLGQHCINFVFQCSILLLAIRGYARGSISLGDITTITLTGINLVTGLWWPLRASAGLFISLATIEDALATIVVPTEVRDIDMPQQAPKTITEIAFERIGFAYGPTPIFTDFTLSIRAGDRVGLVGPSGAGKSTLVQLVLRLFDVQSGAIKISGQDIRQIAQGDLRRNIAMIPQATDLMHRSIRDNIAYGRLDASEEEIVDAAKKAYIHETILGLKDSHGNSGYDSLVGERGVKLSGGQRQRIAIARAFLKNAPILILDEATSALDSESERLIQESLDELFKGRTVIAIAHRLSTIAHLDRVVVMEDGRIVEDGPHAMLVNGGGLYARLWQLQSAGFIGT